MAEIPQLPPKHCASSIREEALQILLPKVLGVLWERGERVGRRTRAFIGEEVELCVIPSFFEDDVWIITVYAPTSRYPRMKVFSAHVASRLVADAKFFGFWDGRCSIISWTRGIWEERVAAEPVESRTVTHLSHAGLTRELIR